MALTLRMLGGLTTPAIARAFLVPEATVAQRIVRAKRALADEKVAFEVPSGDELAPRLAQRARSRLPDLQRGLHGERRRRLDAPRPVRGRAAARPHPRPARPARVRGARARRADGDPGLTHPRAHRPGGQPDPAARAEPPPLGSAADRPRAGGAARAPRSLGLGPYGLQAAIAACHARARRAEDTDWYRITALYEQLARLSPSPVVELNRAVAIGMAFGPAGRARPRRPAAGGARARAPTTCCPSVRADLLAKLGRTDEARAELQRAATLTGNAREQSSSARAPPPCNVRRRSYPPGGETRERRRPVAVRLRYRAAQPGQRGGRRAVPRRELLARPRRVHVEPQDGRGAGRDPRRCSTRTLEHVQPSGWHTTEPPDTADGITTAWIAFETAAGRGNGLLRLRDGKAWTLLTALYELKGYEEPRGTHRPKGVEHGADPDRVTWLEAAHAGGRDARLRGAAGGRDRRRRAGRDRPRRAAAPARRADDHLRAQRAPGRLVAQALQVAVPARPGLVRPPAVHQVPRELAGVLAQGQDRRLARDVHAGDGAQLLGLDDRQVGDATTTTRAAGPCRSSATARRSRCARASSCSPPA